MISIAAIMIQFFTPLMSTQQAPFRMVGDYNTNPPFGSIVPEALRSIGNALHRLSNIANELLGITAAVTFIKLVLTQAHVRFVPFMILEMEASRLPVPSWLWPTFPNADRSHFKFLREETWDHLLTMTQHYVRGIQQGDASSDALKRFSPGDLSTIVAGHVAFIQHYSEGSLQNFSHHPLVFGVKPWLPRLVDPVNSGTPVVNPVTPPAQQPSVQSYLQSLPRNDGQVQIYRELVETVGKLSVVTQERDQLKAKLDTETNLKYQQTKFAKQWQRTSEKHESEVHKKIDKIRSLETEVEDLRSALGESRMTEFKNQTEIRGFQTQVTNMREQLDNKIEEGKAAKIQIERLTEDTTHFRSLLGRGRECTAFFNGGRCNRVDCNLHHTIRQVGNPRDLSHVRPGNQDPISGSRRGDSRSRRPSSPTRRSPVRPRLSSSSEVPRSSRPVPESQTPSSAIGPVLEQAVPLNRASSSESLEWQDVEVLDE